MADDEFEGLRNRLAETWDRVDSAIGNMLCATPSTMSERANELELAQKAARTAVYRAVAWRPHKESEG